jgi:hypothetical protein
MTQQIAKAQPQTTAVTVQPSPEERRQAIADHIDELQLLPQTCSILKARLTAKPIQEATKAELSALWNELVRLVQVSFYTDEEFNQWVADLPVRNAWLIREFGRTSLDEVRLAYNMLVKEELHKADGRVLEAYPTIGPKNLGEVLAAYRRYVDGNRSVTEFLSTGKYLPEVKKEPRPDQIDTFMELALAEALKQVGQGIEYEDIGNGLYVWLFKQGRLRPSDDEFEEALELAKARVLISLADQKEAAAQFSHKGRNRNREADIDDARYNGLENLRTVLGHRLAAIMRQEGDYKKRVRTEACRICLLNYLHQITGFVGPLSLSFSRLPSAPALADEYEVDSTKPFAHTQYIESLKEQLPYMDDETVSNLQRQARTRNVLDVHELATAEWERRQAVKPSAPKSTSKTK